MKLTLKNKDITEQYDLLETAPQPPFVKINNYFLRLSDKGDSKFKLNGLFIYKEIVGKDKFLYYSDKNNILHKINILTQKEVWQYGIKNDIKSIAINSNKHIFILKVDGMLEVDENGEGVSMDATIKGNKMIIDGNIYLADGKKVSKLDSSYNEIASYSVDDNITNLASDKKGNVFIGTNSEITKVKNEFRASEWKYKLTGGEKLGENLLPRFDQWNWKNGNGGRISDSNVLKGNSLYVPTDIATGRVLLYNQNSSSYKYPIKAETKYKLSWKFVRGNKLNVYAMFYNQLDNNLGNIGDKINESEYIFTTPKTTKSMQFEFDTVDTDYEITDVKLQPIEGGGYEYSLATKDDKLYIATKSDIQILNSQGQKIDTLNFTDTNAIAVNRNDMYLGQGNNLNKYINKQKQWTYNNNSEITNIILEE